MNRIKAIFFDIDGTLVSFKTHTIPQSTLEAVSDVRKKGVKVFIATGRPVPFINNLGNLEYDGVMSVNGACCQETSGKVIAKNVVSTEDLRRLIRFHRENPFPIAFASSEDVFLTEKSRESTDVFDLLKVRETSVLPIESCLDMQVLQIIAFFTNEQQPHIMSEVLRNCDAHRWHPYFADVTAKGSSKSTGIDIMLRHYGIALSETMAFGDGGNDISMLSHVAYGIAMGNAGDEVKAAAKYVTSSVDEDGIANVLRKIQTL